VLIDGVLFILHIKPGPLGQVRDIRLCQLFVHFFARPKKRTKKTTPVAFGPLDFFALLKAAGNFQTRFAQTVKIPFRHLFRCSTNANGKYNKLAPYRGSQNRALWAQIFICFKSKRIRFLKYGSAPLGPSAFLQTRVAIIHKVCSRGTVCPVGMSGGAILTARPTIRYGKNVPTILLNIYFLLGKIKLNDYSLLPWKKASDR